MTAIACIGECMIELAQGRGSELSRGYGGDTLNTAVYLARLGADVDYVTAIGDDPFSDEMIEGWRSEGVGTSRVIRIAGKLPGLYAIRTSVDGERSFYYWRDGAAVRMLLDLPESDELLVALAGYDLIYLSGVTLSLYDDAGRGRLVAALRHARAGKTRIAFDTNFRIRGWSAIDTARRAYDEMLNVADIVLASTEDLTPLYGRQSEAEFLNLLKADEAVLKLDEPTCMVRVDGIEHRVEANRVSSVIDTTAAGDSFAAAYLAVRLAERPPVEAARAGHRLAGVVVGHRGAIIPRDAMPSGIMERLT